MDLDGVTNVTEHEDHFRVEHKAHGVFHVAKAMLSSGTKDEIRKFCKGGPVQHFDQGGGVKESAEMDSVPAPDPDLQPAPSASPGAPPQTYGFESGSAMHPAPGSEIDRQFMGEHPVTPAMAEALKSQGVAIGDQAPDPSAASGQTAPTPAAPGAPGAKPVDPMADFNRAFGIMGAGLAEQKAGAMRAIGEGDKASDAEKAAAQQLADNEAKKQAAAAEFQGAQLQNMQRAQDAYKTEKAALQKQSQDLYDNVLNAKIDPNHFWNTRTTGQKIMAGIGMVLGGIGGALAHQGNAGMEMLNNAIARDVDAQKENLGKQKSLLSYNLERTRDLDSAVEHTFVQMQQMTAAKMNQLAAQYGGPEAQARAGEYKAQVDQRSAVFHEQQAQKVGQTTLAQGNLALQKAQLAHQQAALAGGNLNALPEEMRKRAVALPNGQLAFAYDEDSAKEARKTEEAARGLSQVLGNLRQVRKQGGVETPIIPTEAKAKAEATQAQLVPLINELSRLNRLTKEDVDNVLKPLIPDATSWKDGTYKGKLQALEQYLQAKLNASRATSLIGYRPVGAPAQ